jgi:hypothetical protein
VRACDARQNETPGDLIGSPAVSAGPLQLRCNLPCCPVGPECPTVETEERFVVPVPSVGCSQNMQRHQALFLDKLLMLQPVNNPPIFNGSRRKVHFRADESRPLNRIRNQMSPST